MLKRWTNLLTEDGEKEWRQRDKKFEDSFDSKEELLNYWDKGWQCLFYALQPLNDKDLNQIVYIRNQGHTVTEAINRQLAHYAYHIGQLVFLGKLTKGKNWKSLSIPKGESIIYNKEKFKQQKGIRHFTDDL
jgi:predicted SprT family Zn-dependent metalloprotease